MARAGTPPGTPTYSASRSRAAGRTATGAYPWQEQILLGQSNQTTLTVWESGTAIVVANGSNDPFGAGWSLSGLGQIIPDTYDNGVWRIDGQGDAGFFLANSTSPVYESPPGDFGTLQQNSNGGYTYTAPDQTKWNYGQNLGGGVYDLTTVVDPHGLALTYSYNGSNEVSTVTAPDGGVTSFSYAGSALTGITEPGNRVLTLGRTAPAT